MPASSKSSVDSSPVSSPPSMLDCLGQFKYEKCKSPNKKKKLESVQKSDSFGSQVAGTTSRDALLVVPETPESELGDPNSPVFRPVKRTKKNISVTDSDSDSQHDSDKNTSEHSSSNCDSESVASTSRTKRRLSRNSESPPRRKMKKSRMIDSDDDDDDDDGDDDGDVKDDQKSQSPVGRVQRRNRLISIDSDTDLQEAKTEKSNTKSRNGVIFISDDSGDDSVHPQSPISVTNNLKSSPVDSEEDVADGSSSVETDGDDESESRSRSRKNGKTKIDMTKPVYDSDDSETDMEETAPRRAVKNFLNDATLDELLSVPGCRKAKADSLMAARPFTTWQELVYKVSTGKYLTTDLLLGAQTVVNVRIVIKELMQHCEMISADLGRRVSQLMDGKGEPLKTQPKLLDPTMNLATYQMLGLNWLILMHRQKLNGILADEMGLGKTVQAIAFLAHLLEVKQAGPHLVIVPASTLDNWVREFAVWCKSLEIRVYFGNQEQRRVLRRELLRGYRKRSYHVIVTTYHLVTSPEDRMLIRAIPFHYVIFDEAHMLKNMASQRYQKLTKIDADYRLLLTGTPLQNNLIELMSLLMFVMPKVFAGKTEEVVRMFGSTGKSGGKDSYTNFAKERIEQAKQIMRPFILRRLKCDVLKDLPSKDERIHNCQMSPTQRQIYDKSVARFNKQMRENKEDRPSMSGMSMMMELRKLANHPLLIRDHYSDAILKKMAKLMLKEPTHRDANVDLVCEDMSVMSDFELHKLCCVYKNLHSHKLKSDQILDSGKFQYLKSHLKALERERDRVLLFSQFTMMLDIMEEYLNILGYKFIRLDGNTPVTERQALIDRFSTDLSIFIFLLSTKAGGLGINLTAANTVILYDIDFNPYNDKQAEDRCHRVGQTRTVTITRLVTTNSIEEGILKCANDKLKLERDITTGTEVSTNELSADVATLLKNALAL